MTSHRFPLSAYVVLGSQADRADANSLTVMKLEQLGKMKRSAGDDSDSEDNEEEGEESDEDEDAEPVQAHDAVAHPDGVNRVRARRAVAQRPHTGAAHNAHRHRSGAPRRTGQLCSA